MDVVNNFTHKTLTVLLEYVGILFQFSEPDWFLETCETLLEMPMNIAIHCPNTVSTLQVTLHTLIETGQ